MTQEEIKNKALELYPIKPYPIQCKDFNRVETVDLNEIARNAYIKGYQESLSDNVDDFSESYNTGFYDGYNKARKEVLDNLPKWKKAIEDINDDYADYVIHLNHFVGDAPFEIKVITNRVKEGEYYIHMDDLDKLEKEE